MSGATLYRGDCLEVLAAMEPGVDAIVCDPPYGLSPDGKARTWDDIEEGRSRGGFMGKAWDGAVPGVEWARACLRVLLPGGHLVAFGGTRTVHRLACAIEDAGFEIRDTVAWVQFQGFPKSLAVGAAIDRHQGRLHTSVVALKKELRDLFDASGKSRKTIDAECGFRACNYLSYPEPGKQPDPWFNVLPSQAKWQVIKQVLGVGGADREARLDGFFAEAEREVIGFKKVIPGVAFSSDGPSEMPVTLPATEAARTWEGFGTGLKPAWEGVILARKPFAGTVAANVIQHGTGVLNIDGCRYAYGDPAWPGPGDSTAGQWDREWSQSEAPWAEGWDASTSRAGGPVGRADLGRWPANLYACPKPSRAEREAGCERLPGRTGAEATDRTEGTAGLDSPRAGAGRTADRVKNHHPTVKPLGVMRFLVKLVGGQRGSVILDPFMGSGTTGCAAVLEGFEFIGIEREAEYMQIAEARIRHHQGALFANVQVIETEEGAA